MKQIKATKAMNKHGINPFRKTGYYSREYLNMQKGVRSIDYKKLKADTIIATIPTGESFEITIEDHVLNVRSLQSSLIVLPRASNSFDLRTEAAYQIQPKEKKHAKKR